MPAAGCGAARATARAVCSSEMKSVEVAAMLETRGRADRKFVGGTDREWRLRGSGGQTEAGEVRGAVECLLCCGTSRWLGGGVRVGAVPVRRDERDEIARWGGRVTSAAVPPGAHSVRPKYAGSASCSLSNLQQ